MKRGDFIKINKDELRALSELSDKELWQSIGKIASSHGYSLKDVTPSESELEKIRGALRDIDKINIRDAIKLLNEYKKRK